MTNQSLVSIFNTIQLNNFVIIVVGFVIMTLSKIQTGIP